MKAPEHYVRLINTALILSIFVKRRIVVQIILRQLTLRHHSELCTALCYNMAERFLQVLCENMGDCISVPIVYWSKS